MAVEMKRTCFIHIGPHKTGTTSIQKFLTENADRLANNGVLFPSLTDDKGAAATHNILMAQGLKPNGAIRRKSKAWAVVEGALKQGEKNILLSHESFATRITKAATLKSIIRFFGDNGYGVHIIAYVRSQPDWLNSWYVQQQKRFYAKNSFEEFVEQWYATGRVDPLRYLNGLMDNPDIKLEVVSFDMAIKSGLEVDFCRRLGVNPDAEWASPGRINSNAGAKTIYVAQRVMESSDILSPKSPLHGRIKAVLRNARRKHNWREEPFMALNDEIARSIAQKYEASNRKFLARYPIGAYEDVFPLRTYRQQLVDPSQISEAELRELDAVVENILKLIAKRSERVRLKGRKAEGEAAKVKSSERAREQAHVDEPDKSAA